MEYTVRKLSINGFKAVKGPAVISIIDGVVEVMGYPLREGRIIVPQARVAIIRGEGGVVEVKGSPDSVIELPAREYEEVYDIARMSANANKVMLIGPVDVGKSTLASMIAGVVSARTGYASILTLDVGQNEVFCPGFEAIATVNPPVIPGRIDSFRLLSSCFVGSFTPSLSVDRYVDCSVKLSKLSDRIVIDTDGWVDEKGLEVKADIAEKTQVDLIIAIGESSGRLRILRDRGLDVIEVKPIAKSSKTSEERRIHRERLIASRLTRSKTISLPLDLLSFISGKPRLRPGYGVISAVYTRSSVSVGLLIKLDEKRGRAAVITEAIHHPSLIEVGVSEVDISLMGFKINSGINM